MLQAIGIRSVDDLFSPIPAEYRLARDLAIPRQMAESEIVDWFKQRAKENGEGYTSFLAPEPTRITGRWSLMRSCNAANS
jgi:glycine dehydrogenase subunit 1